MITVSGVIIVIMSYILYRERISISQAIGILMILGSIVLISLSKNEVVAAASGMALAGDTGASSNSTEPAPASSNSTAPAKAEPAPASSPSYEDDLAADANVARTLAILSAILASICFAGEALLIRYLGSWGVSGEIAGFFYLFFEGCLGTACLIVATATGHGLLDYDVASCFLILVAGFAITGGVVLLNYSISIGVAGVCFSISNSNAAIQALFTYLLFSQDLTAGQIAGILLSLAGACVLSLADKLDKMCRRKRPKSMSTL